MLAITVKTRRYERSIIPALTQLHLPSFKRYGPVEMFSDPVNTSLQLLEFCLTAQGQLYSTPPVKLIYCRQLILKGR